MPFLYIGVDINVFYSKKIIFKYKIFMFILKSILMKSAYRKWNEVVKFWLSKKSLENKIDIKNRS